MIRELFVSTDPKINLESLGPTCAQCKYANPPAHPDIRDSHVACTILGKGDLDWAREYLPPNSYLGTYKAGSYTVALALAIIMPKDTKCIIREHVHKLTSGL